MGKRKLYGIAELAAATGQRNKTVSVWHSRGKLPTPTHQLAMGPVWEDSSDIRKWIAENRRGSK